MKYFTKEEKEKFLLSDYLKMSDDMFKKEIFKESDRLASTKYLIEDLGVAYLDIDTYKLFIRQFQNFTDAQLYGFEVGFNQSLSFLPAPFDGFGIRGNYNRTLGSFDEEIGITENGFPGSSKNSVNGVFYYDKHGLGVRVAYSWRDDFYRVVPDPFGGNLGIQTARFQQGAGSLSTNASYNFNKNFQLSISGSNITGENRRMYLGSSTQNLTDFFQLEPTWLIGGRYRF